MLDRARTIARVDALFVYGTLRRGRSNHALVAACRSAEPARIRGRLYDLHLGYPALADSERPDEEVEGELLTFDDLQALLPLLDDYEGSLYTRVLRVVRVESGEERRAYVYVVEDEGALIARGATRIDCGSWPPTDRR